MARENRLEIRIAARADQFEQALKKVEADAKKVSASLSDSFSGSGEGIDSLIAAVSRIEETLTRFEKEGKSALSEIGQGATKSGKDIDSAFTRAEKALDEAEKGAEEFSKAVSDFSRAKSEVDQLGKAFEGVENQVKETKNATDSLSAVELAERLSADVGALSSRFEAAGERARDLRRDIRLAFSNPKDQEKYIKTAEQLRDKYGELIEVADFGKAIKRLDNLGSASEKNLERISKLALDAGRDLEDAADDIAEFLAPLESGNADFALLDETLRANFGIAAKALKQYGAEVDSNGKLIARTREQQRKAQEALRRYIDESERYNNIATRSKDAQDKLADATERFNKSVGDQVTEFKNTIAAGLLPYIDNLNGLSDNTKAIIGVTASGTAAVASFGAKALEMAAYFKLAGGSAKGLAAGVTRLGGAIGVTSAATAAFAGGILIAVGLVATIVKSFYDWRVSIEDVEKAQKKLLETQNKALNDDRVKFVKKSVEAIIAETDAIEDAGKRRATINDAIIAKQAAAEQARAKGFREEAGRLEAEASSLKRQRSVYDADSLAVAKAEKAKTEARKRAYDDAVEAFNEFKLKTQRGEFESSEAALQALDRLSSGLDGDALKEANAERRKLQKDALKDALDSAKAQAQAGKISIDEFERQSKQLIQKYQVRGQALKEVERENTEFIKSQNEQRYQAALQYENQITQIQQQRLADQKSAANPELEAIQKRLEKGEEVEAQAKALLTEQNKVTKSILDQEAAVQRIIIAREKEAELRKDALTGGQNAEAIAKIAAERERALNEQVARQKAELDKQLAAEKEKLDDSAAKKAAARDAKLADLAQKRLAAEQQAARDLLNDKLLALDEEERRGRDVSEQRKRLAQEEIELQRKQAKENLAAVVSEIEAKRKAANAGANDNDKAVNDEEARLAILEAQRKEKETQKQITQENSQSIREQIAQEKELLKQLQDQTKERSKQQGIQTSFGASDSAVSFDESFGQSRFKGPTTEDGRTADDLQKSITRKEIELTRVGESARAEPPLDITPIVQNGTIQNQTLQSMLGDIRQLVSLARTFGQKAPSAENAGSRFAEGGTRLPGNPL